MQRNILRILLCLIGLGIVPTEAQERRRDEPISDELYSIVEQRASEIKEELKESGGNEWAGTYLAGDHHPTVFLWSPENGFVVTSSLHTFSPSWVNFGKISFANTKLKIFPELVKDQKSSHIMSTEFVPVLWGKQHFLIAPDELTSFAVAVHSGSEAQIVNYFAKAEDSRKTRRGLPNLPREYRKYLVMRPVAARIVAIGKEEDLWRRQITIDRGSDNGVIEQMILYHLEKSGNYMKIRIDKVSRTTSTATVYGLGTVGSADTDSDPKLGWSFSSRLPKGLAE